MNMAEIAAGFALGLAIAGFCGNANAGVAFDTTTPEAIIECLQKPQGEKPGCLDALIARDESPLVRLVRGSENKFTGDRVQSAADFDWALKKGFPLIHTNRTSNTEDPEGFRSLVFRMADAGMGDGAKYYVRRSGTGRTQKEAEELTFLRMIACHPASLKDVNHLYIVTDWAKQQGITDRREMIVRYQAVGEEQAKHGMEVFAASCWSDTDFFPLKTSRSDVDAGMKRARIRTAKAIGHIRSSLRSFPELAMFTYEELLYTPNP